MGAAEQGPELLLSALKGNGRRERRASLSEEMDVKLKDEKDNEERESGMEMELFPEE